MSRLVCRELVAGVNRHLQRIKQSGWAVVSNFAIFYKTPIRDFMPDGSPISLFSFFAELKYLRILHPPIFIILQKLNSISFLFQSHLF